MTLIPPSFLRDIAERFANLDKVESLIWCGSAGRGKSDRFSDFDIYVYHWQEPRREDRERIVASRSRNYELDHRYWELEDEWIEPNGAQVNVMYRSCSQAEEEIDFRLRKSIASLRYTTAYCFCIAEGFILADPNGWCLALQNQLKRNYPDDLVRSIVLTNRAVMGGRILSGYFEQIQAAISRDDIVSVNHRVAAFLASYYDILFAVNRRYHPGEKRLLQYGNELEIIPENAMANVQRLCQLAGIALAQVVPRTRNIYCIYAVSPLRNAFRNPSICPQYPAKITSVTMRANTPLAKSTNQDRVYPS
jgi:predicted nucleotidyltransferase